jgi:hypothetical protein
MAIPDGMLNNYLDESRTGDFNFDIDLDSDEKRGELLDFYALYPDENSSYAM